MTEPTLRQARVRHYNGRSQSGLLVTGENKKLPFYLSDSRLVDTTTGNIALEAQNGRRVKIPCEGDLILYVGNGKTSGPWVYEWELKKAVSLLTRLPRPKVKVKVAPDNLYKLIIQHIDAGTGKIERVIDRAWIGSNPQASTKLHNILRELPHRIKKRDGRILRVRQRFELSVLGGDWVWCPNPLYTR